MTYNTTAYKELKQESDHEPLESFRLLRQDGNAFALMGAFRREAQRAGWSQHDIDVVLNECQTDTYDHLLATLMEWEG